MSEIDVGGIGNADNVLIITAVTISAIAGVSLSVCNII